MDYIAPSYDIWQLGCLLFEAATGGKLFHADLRQRHLRVKKTDRGYNDQHFILACMVEVLGLMPRQVRWIAVQAVQCCTVQYGAVQYSAVQYRTTTGTSHWHVWLKCWDSCLVR